MSDAEKIAEIAGCQPEEVRATAVRGETLWGVTTHGQKVKVDLESGEGVVVQGPLQPTTAPTPAEAAAPEEPEEDLPPVEEPEVKPKKARKKTASRKASKK